MHCGSKSFVSQPRHQLPAGGAFTPWLLVFYGSCTFSFRKNRNMHAEVMLHMLRKGSLDGIYTHKPEQGPLITFPAYMVWKQNKAYYMTLFQNEIVFHYVCFLSLFVSRCTTKICTKLSNLYVNSFECKSWTFIATTGEFVCLEPYTRLGSGRTDVRHESGSSTCRAIVWTGARSFPRSSITFSSSATSLEVI